MYPPHHRRKEVIEQRNSSINGDQKWSDKHVNQISNQPNNVEQGSESSMAGDTHCPIAMFPGRDKKFTSTQIRDDVHAERN